jgi:hypothetical protein
MRKPVMQRKLFANGGRVESEGILSGFNDEMEDGYEDRTPENLEIIANNLRGDIRSLDERYLELAQLVGEAAFETPEEVLALIQPQLGQPTPTMGIEGLGAPPVPEGGITEGFGVPEEGMMQPEMGMPPEQGMMPPEQGMAPQEGTQQAPIGMADGGIVYRSNGSGPFGEIPRGVTGRPLAGGNIPGMNLDAMRAARLLSEMQGKTPASTQLGQNLYGNLLNMYRTAGPAMREVGRTIAATPYGKPAAVLAAGATPLLLDAGQRMFPGSAEAPGGPVYSEVPGVDAEGRYQPMLQSLESMVGTPEQKAAIRNTGFQDFTPRLGMADIGAGAPSPEEVVAAGETTAPETDAEQVARISAMQATAPERKPGETEKSFRDRVKDKMDIYSEFLGGDPEMRKAQALFLLAEAALNVAGATGRSTGERLAKGLKGLPAGMAAIGAEAEKERRAVAAAAIQSVEAEDTARNKAIADLVKARAGKKPGKPEQISAVLQTRFGMPEPAAALLANEIDAGLVEIDKDTGEAVDKLQGTIRFSPHRPLAATSVGYLDPNNPFVQTLDTDISPAPLSERKDKLSRRTELQKSITRNEQMLGDIYGDAVGFLPTIQSGVSRMFLATVGDSPFLPTNVQKNQIRQNLQINRESILKSNLRNSGRPSVYDQKKIEGLIEDPNKLFASPELVVSSISNFIREDLNELARLDAELFGTPLRQMGRIPTGSASDPLPIGPNSQMILTDIFTKRPNATIYTTYRTPEGRSVTAKMTAKDFFAQSQGQAR